MNEEVITNREAREHLAKDYEWGFSSDIEQEFAPQGPVRRHGPLHLRQEE